MITTEIFVYYFPWAEVIGGAATIGTGVYNTASAGKMNKKNRKWQEEMYAKNLKDTRENWEIQNAYNNPSAAMERLKAAGLNPALMYGGSGAAGQAGPIGSPTLPSAATTTPQLDYQAAEALGGAAKAVQYQQQQKNVDLTNAQIRKTEAEAQQTEIDNTSRGERNSQNVAKTYEQLLNLQKQTRNADDQQAQIRARTAQIISDTDVNKAKAASSIEQGKVRMASQLNLMQILNDRNAWNNANQKFDYDMKKVGIAPNSNEWWRMFGTMLKDLNNQTGGTGKGFIDRGAEYLKHYNGSK